MVADLLAAVEAAVGAAAGKYYVNCSNQRWG